MHRIARDQANHFVEHRARCSKQRPANADLRFDPRIARGFHERNERAHERNENRRAHLESAFARRQQMAAFVNEDEQHKANGEPHAPYHRIDPDGDEHRAAGFEDHRDKFQDGQNDELELRKKLCDQNKPDHPSDRAIFSASGRKSARPAAHVPRIAVANTRLIPSPRICVELLRGQIESRDFNFQDCESCYFSGVILVIDNYDSFTYNLVQYLGELKVELQVHRNDQISVEQVRALNPERILISPGPCSPRESGLSNEIIRTFGPEIPLFGVCLGHQCIGHTFGGNVIVNYRMMHGKTSLIKHNGKDLFLGMPNPFAATRYHSLVIQSDTIPDCLEVTAKTDEGEIMGVKHKEYPIWGVQFDPESILTENGRQILKNFLKLK